VNQELKEKWLEALRSGQYEQGFGRLKLQDRYCCLGVLCDVSDTGRFSIAGDFIRHDYSVMRTTLDSNMSSDLGVDYDTRDRLIRMNDSLGYTFPEIANWIEVNL
jgi:hypothetical protein